MQANRRLPDGSYWTTGLASGLDNSPSLGEAYPDLTAQMAHDAEHLSLIARALGRTEEAEAWAEERIRTADALNARCWNEEAASYTTALEGGGHNPNKTIAGFWPLWAGAAPADRADALARHAQDSRAFNRHHPLASLAADSTQFDPRGRYWLGSVWPPTNYMAISGLHRAGHHELSWALALQHLERVSAVFRATGRLWENYSSEADEPGGWSGEDFGWSALGPIALLFEVVLGLRANALDGVLEWRPPPGDVSGVRRFPFGRATVDLTLRAMGNGSIVQVVSDGPFTLRLRSGAEVIERALPAGTSQLFLPA
jgi:glycogen debranching enzyme